MQKFFNVNMFSQRRRPKFRCNACRPRGKFATNSRIFWWKKMRNRRTRGFFGAQHGTDLRRSCADVVRVVNQNPRKRRRKIRCAARRNRKKNLQQIRASTMQILAKFCACSTAACARVRHCNRHKLDAEILQRQNVFAATPADILVRCTSTAQKFCNEFARFL